MLQLMSSIPLVFAGEDSCRCSSMMSLSAYRLVFEQAAQLPFQSEGDTETLQE